MMLLLPVVVVVVFLLENTTATTTLISESDGRLPMGLSSVITDLEAEGVEHVTTVCVLTSRGVTPTQRGQLVSRLFGLEGRTASTSPASLLTAFGTTPEEDDVDGLAIAQPDMASTSASQVASTVVACGGTVVYLPDRVDLQRGEGLFDGGLGPSMERLLHTSAAATTATTAQQDNGPDDDDNNNDSPNDGDTMTRRSCLVVVVPEGMSVETAKVQLERAAAALIPNLVHPSTSSTRNSASTAMVLADVFDAVQYVTLPPEGQTLEDLLTEHLGDGSSCQPSQALSLVASTVDVLSLMTTSAATAMTSSTTANSLVQSPKDLAAARQLGPAARSSMDGALDSVRQVLAAQRLVPNYGDLCHAVVTRAVKDLGGVPGSAVSKQIHATFKEELYAELGDVFQQQLKVLQMAKFEEFRKALSQLKVSPLLPQDMDEAIKSSIASFVKAAHGMVYKRAKPSWSIGPAKMEYSRMIRDYSTERLLAARASGAFRPLPRKGVTVGLHWLLPKPFGNDYRQEPWTVHAMDNLVYVPPDKVTSVSPDDVKSGDWRKQIVPSPASRDMVFMQ